MPASVIWVAAHPDDEAVISPLLAEWCLNRSARCTIVEFTRGDAGECLRADGCAPDLGSVRSSEAGSASQYFKSSLTLLTLPDGGGAVAPPWSENDAVITTLAGLIEAFSPEIVLTFDPRHGTTCHPDHRAVGEIVLAAVRRLPNPPPVYLLETRINIGQDPSLIRFDSATAAALRYDATALLSATGQPAWNAITEDMQRHPSQFPEAWITAIQNVPVSERAVYLGPAPAMLALPITPCP